jgi:hypothetical protein
VKESGRKDNKIKSCRGKEIKIDKQRNRQVDM